jgi:hypothetical protein
MICVSSVHWIARRAVLARLVASLMTSASSHPKSFLVSRRVKSRVGEQRSIQDIAAMRQFHTLPE